MGEIVNEFSPFEAYIASSGTMDVDQQEGIFQFASHLISLCPITSWDMFSKRVLTCRSDDQPRVMAISTVILEVFSGPSLDIISFIGSLDKVPCC